MSLAGRQIIPIDLNFHLQKCLEIFDKKSADKIQFKNYKKVNPPCLMPVRVNTRLKSPFLHNKRIPLLFVLPYEKSSKCVLKCLHINICLIFFPGAKVVVVEKRDRYSRNNVLHLWPYNIADLRGLGAKKFYGKFCAGSIDHISIRALQCILLKVALLLGVEVFENCGFEGM